MNKKVHLLVVDDDDDIRELLQTFLTQNHYEVSVAEDGKVMREQLARHDIDLVILDLMLPEEDGLQLCRFIQNSENPLPVIMLTALGSDVDRIIGLELGADDYLPKPFNPRELLARIKAVLRRAQPKTTITAQATWLHFDQWRLLVEKRELYGADGHAIALSAGEFDLLMILLKHPQQILSRDHLLDLTRGIEATPFDRSIDIQISRLRKKLNEDSRNPILIKTVRNGGYQLDATVTQSMR